MNHPIKILYLEDNPLDAELVRDRLQHSSGMTCNLQVVTDREAYETALAKSPFDLIISDYSLPGYSGPAALALAHAQQPGVPFILVSGTICDEQAVGFMLRGATDCVLKNHLTRLVPAVLRAVAEADERRQRREAGAALRESEAEFRAMFEMASIGMAQADPRTGQWLRVNRRMCEITGYAADELLRLRIAEITHPADRQQDAELLQRVVRGEAPDCRLEKRYLRKDGTVVWVNVNTTIIRDSAGQPTRTMATIEDITTRREAEESRARLATAVEQSAEAVVITATDGVIAYVNPAFTRITGYSRAEVVGQNVRILKSGKQDLEFYRRMWAALTTGQVWSGRMTNRRKDGSLYQEEMSISPVRNAAGMVVNYVAVKRDVTHEAELESQLRQAQKMEAVGRLAGGVAHDFNNLLMGIMSYVELCRDQLEPGAPMREWLDEITIDAQRSAEITRQLLAFARKQAIAPKVLALNDAVAGMLNLLQRLIGEDIHLTWHPGAGLRPVRIDPAQVDQILANLCVNARDAMAAGGTITLETGNIILAGDSCSRHADALPGAYVFVAVSDDGCGMDKETVGQVFEPFFTTKGIGMGTGLGLATVYGIVKQNSGFIQVDSEPGRGTTFRIYLPQVEAEVVVTTGPRKTAAPRARGETILLVEDEKSPRVTCGMFLEALGYNVLLAETPGEAMKRVGGHPGEIHLLLTDVILPGMDGRQLAQRVTTAKPDVKVLFMSGYTSDAIAQRGVLEQNTGFIGKPFSRDELARKVREVLDGPEKP